MGGWNAFCEEHYKEAFEYIKKKYEDFLINMIDFIPCGDEKDMLCGHPYCRNKPIKEIIWVRDLKDLDLE